MDKLAGKYLLRDPKPCHFHPSQQCWLVISFIGYFIRLICIPLGTTVRMQFCVGDFGILKVLNAFGVRGREIRPVIDSFVGVFFEWVSEMTDSQSV